MVFRSAIPLSQLGNVGVAATELLAAASQTIKEYDDMWMDANWKGIPEHLRKIHGLAVTIEDDVAQRGRIAVAAQLQLATIDKGMKDFFSTLADAEGPVADALRDHLVNLFEEDGHDGNAEELATSMLAGEGSLFSRAKQFASLHDELEERLIASGIRLRSLGMSGAFVGFLQLAAVDVQGAIAQRRTAAGLADDFPISPEEGDRQLVGALAEEMTTLVNEGYASIFEVLENDEGLLKLAAEAGKISEQGSPLPAVAAKLLAGFLVLIKDAPPSEVRTADYRKALDLTESVQRLILLVVYARTILTNLRSKDSKRWYGHEQRRLRNRSFASLVPQGNSVALSAVAGADNGNLVQVEGFVSTLSIEDDPAPPKFSTFLTLVSDDGETSLKVRAHQFSLESNGVSPGVYIRLNGFVRRQESWLEDGIVGLDIDRVALSELRRDSWLDDVTFRMRSYFTLYLDGMSLFHTPNLQIGEN